MATRARTATIIVQTLYFVTCSWLVVPVVFAASSNSALLKAKQEAESKGYIFFNSHDEIVSGARKEGKLRVQTALETAKVITEAFRKRYPFIDLQLEEIHRVEDGQRTLLQIKAGTAKDWDILRIYTDLYGDYLPHLQKIDLVGMSEHKILAIPPKMFDPKNRNVMAVQSQFHVTAYNRNLISTSQVPKTWEEFLRPDLKGRKFAVDVRPQEIAALVPAWGLEKALDFARKIAAQQPIWVRGGTRTLTSMVAGEIPMFIGPNFGSVKGIQRKDPLGAIQFVILEPVPVRVSEEHAILATSKNTHAALLWLEFMASSEAQKLIDELEPLASSFYVPGSALEQELREKKLSVVSWEENSKMGQWLTNIFEAYGFPKANATITK